MALCAGAPARASRMARSIDRGSSRGSLAGHPERLRRGPASERPGEPDERAGRTARGVRLLHPALLRQFRLKLALRGFGIGAGPRFIARAEVVPDARPLPTADKHPAGVRGFRRRELWPEPGMKSRPTRPCSPLSAFSIIPSPVEAASHNPYAAFMRSPPQRPRIHTRQLGYWTRQRSRLRLGARHFRPEGTPN